jgi:sensor c-di-GMP phosphodiesterase-like protein
MLLAAILAFVPVLAVDYLLDNYVRARQQAQLQLEIESITDGVQAATKGAMASLAKILADSPSLCTPTFVGNVHKQMQASLYVRQVLVENNDGVQYCDAFGGPVSYSMLSESLSIPGRSETIAIARLPGLEVPVLKITLNYSTSRKISAFVPILPLAPNALAIGKTPGAMTRLSLTNGTQVATIGDASPYDKRGNDSEFIVAQAFAGELPIKVESAEPFAVARAGYTDLDVAFTIIACIMSAGLLLLMLQYVRRSQLPAFDLERAIAAGELRPYYQPVINLSTGRLAGCEVLIRWEKRDGEVVSPGSFIDYAEATGLAIPMTLNLMQQVRADLSQLCADMPDLKVSINLFEGHFRDGMIVEDVQAIFGDSPIGFRQLVFEITERRPLANSTVANAVIAGLHALGCRLAMDDVGTGHSNLAYMQTLGVDIIKIDRVFIDMIKPDTTQVPVLDGLIAMAKDLGTEIVAEGVETEAQALYLRARGVVMAQGYLFAPAIKVGPFVDIARVLNAPRKGAVSQPADPVAKVA